MSRHSRIIKTSIITAAIAMGTAGTASAQGTVDPQDPVGSLPGLIDDALTQKEGCDYPGVLVPVVAQVSRDAVEGCGYFETDPAHPNNPG